MSKINQSDVKVEHKTVSFDVSNVDGEGRTFEAHAAVFGNVDGVGDIIHPGAFTKTITERGSKVKLLWQHKSDEPLGKIQELREDGKGLYVKAVISDTRQGRDTLALLKDGAVGEMSIGFDAQEKGTDYSENDGDTIRNLRELRLWEISLVTFPANEEAQVLALKERTFETKTDMLREAHRLLSEVLADSEESVSEAAEAEAGPPEQASTSDADAEALRLEAEILEVM